MRVELVRIGNSRGIRIPKPLIEQCQLGDVLDLRVEGDTLLLSRPRCPREGWAEAFRAAGAGQEEMLLEPMGPNEFDRREWQW